MEAKDRSQKFGWNVDDVKFGGSATESVKLKEFIPEDYLSNGKKINESIDPFATTIALATFIFGATSAVLFTWDKIVSFAHKIKDKINPHVAAEIHNKVESLPAYKSIVDALKNKEKPSQSDIKTVMGSLSTEDRKTLEHLSQSLA